MSDAVNMETPLVVLAWHPMSTHPYDGNFRLYGLHVTNNNGFKWFDVHYLAMDDGQLVEPCGDYFSNWNFEDFEVWADASPPPKQSAE